MFSDLMERMRALLFGRPLEREMDEELRFPDTLAAGAATLLLAALLACWLPGRRAARIRPVEAIAAE